ncbi:MAG: flagellar filament capping protein FliD, partial [Sedimentisphaerales bacterium]|nr:flagellar filament capping protein FliD [Sedimentisphaerales bacterium]
LNTVLLSSLNGGSGGATESTNYGENRITQGGIINLTDGQGNSSEIDLTDAVSVQDVIDKINNLYEDDNTTNIRASLNATGNGIILSDSSASGSMNISDVSGNLASMLKLAGTGNKSIDSGNLQLQYISEATNISSLRNGAGITRGAFSITDSEGNKKSVDLVKDSIQTVGDVIDAINNAGLKVEARINDTGDGIMLTDTSTAASKQPIKVTDNSSGTAAGLGLMARDSVKDANGNYYLDGSYELTLALGGADDLDDVAQKVNDAGLGVNASVVNDGSGYRLSFASDTSGRKGTVYFDAGQTSMKVDNVSTAKDAIILLGDGSEEHPMLINSNTNSIKDAIYGATLEIKKVSDDPVTISINDDVDGMVERVNSFVESYNAVMEYISEVTSFNAETYEKGILFADSTVSAVKKQMVNIVQKTFGTDTGSYKTMSSIGIKFQAMGSQTGTDANGNPVTYATSAGLSITFNEETFRTAFSAEPESVSKLFNSADIGVSDYISDLLDSVASSSNKNSTIQNRIESINNTNTLLGKRITSLNEQLNAKELRMYKQFYAMEETLAKLQKQQSAITSLGTLSS